MKNELVIETKLDTTGLEEGLEDIKDEYSDEEITMNTEETSKGMEAISKITEKIAHNLGGMTISSAKFLGNIAGTLTKLGLIGGILGIVAIVALGIANSFKNAVEENEELQTKLIYLRLLIQSAMNAFASAGEFLVKIFSWVIDRAFDVMVILGSIIKLITGINIFASEISNNFEDANSNVSQMKKTLAGFDEMNVISGGSGGVGLLGDIASDFSNLRNLQEEVNKTTSKIKEWFTKSLPTREELEEYYRPSREFWGKIGDWFEENVTTPVTILFKQVAEVTKPLWQPVADAFKQAYGPLVNYVEEHFISPLRDKFTTFRDNFLSKYAKFINKIIYWINLVFGAFGVNLDYIDEESAITGKDIDKNINDKLQKTYDKLNNLGSPLQTIWDKLKELTSKAWNIVTNFVANGPSQSTTSSWLQPLRDKLAQIGIKLPHFAKGGIINMPGRGVPIGGGLAKGGEVAPEGVIPLTDSQQMAMLGEAIGKYITINATIPVYAYNRQVDRQMMRIRAEDNFAGNR